MTQQELLQQRLMEVVDFLRQKGGSDIIVALVVDGCVAVGGNEAQSELAERIHECAVDWMFTDPASEPDPPEEIEEEEGDRW